MKKIILYVFILNIFNNNSLGDGKREKLKDVVFEGIIGGMIPGVILFTVIGGLRIHGYIYYDILYPEKYIDDLEVRLKELEINTVRSDVDKSQAKAKIKAKIDELKQKIAARELKKKQSQINNFDQNKTKEFIDLLQSQKTNENLPSFHSGETALNRNYEIPQAYLLMKRATSTMSFLMLNIFKNQSNINKELFSPDHHRNPFLL